MNYIYDGSFQGLLTIIYEEILSEENPDNIFIEKIFCGDLFSENKIIITNEKKAEKVVKTLSNKFGLNMMQNIYYAFLSNENNIEKEILDYVKLSFNHGKNVDDFYTNDSVLAVKKAYGKVAWERQKFFGILRFKLLKDGLYYAAIEPDNNIVGLLMNHFEKRFPNKEWLIHDISRNIGVFCKDGKARLISIDDFEEKLLQEGENLDKNVFDENEEKYQNLWKIFFKKIAITERKNLKLQRQFLPARYWKYLPEMK